MVGICDCVAAPASESSHAEGPLSSQQQYLLKRPSDADKSAQLIPIFGLRWQKLEATVELEAHANKRIRPCWADGAGRSSDKFQALSLGISPINNQTFLDGRSTLEKFQSEAEGDLDTPGSRP